MKDEAIVITGKRYLSAKKAAKLAKYTPDYVGQLARAGKIQSRMINKTRFVEEDSFREYLMEIGREAADLTEAQMKDDEVVIAGERYLSTKKIAKLAKYTPDYVGQLARSGKMESTMIGKTRFVKADSFRNYLTEIGRSTDALDVVHHLAPTQDFVKSKPKKVSQPQEVKDTTTEEQEKPKYFSDARDAFPAVSAKESADEFVSTSEDEQEAEEKQPLQTNVFFGQKIAAGALTFGMIFALVSTFQTDRVRAQMAEFQNAVNTVVATVQESGSAIAAAVGSPEKFNVLPVNKFDQRAMPAGLFSLGGDAALFVYCTLSGLYVGDGQCSRVSDEIPNESPNLVEARKRLLAENDQEPEEDEQPVRVVERVVERVRTPELITSGVSVEELEVRLQELSDEMRSLIAESSTSTREVIVQRHVQPVERTVALTQIIDQLSDVDITNPTITGGTISDMISIETNKLTVGNLSANSLTTTGGITSYTSVTAPIFIATSTTATSTFAGGFDISDGGFVYDWQTENVGIGTTSPSATLTVNGTTYLSNATSGLSFRVDDQLGDVTPFVIDEFGNVGIGTTSPVHKLDVWGNLAVGTSSTPALFVDTSTGNVGIGTTSPFTQFSVTGSGSFSENLFVEGDASVDGSITFGTSTDETAIFNARIGSSLVPSADNTFNIGTTSPWLSWRSGFFGTSVSIGGTATTTGTDLTSSGPFTIDTGDTLSINTNNNQDVAFGTGLLSFLRASSTQQSIFDTLYVGSTATTTLTSDALAFPGSATIDGSSGTLTVEAGDFDVNASGAVTINGSTITLADPTVLSDTLDVTGLATFAAGFISQASSTVASDFTVTGDTIFGDTPSDALTVNARIASDLIPDQNATRDLGSASFYWDDAFVDTLTANSISAASTTISGTQSDTFAINTDNATADDEDATLIFYRGTVVPNALLTWDSTRERFDFNQPLYIQNDSSTTTVPTLGLAGTVGQSADVLHVASSSGADLFSVTSAGTVGVSSSSPAATFSVTGDAWITGQTLLGTDGSNVGIGTTSPFAKLSVAGDGYFDGDLTVNSLTSTTSISAPFFVATDASATSTFAGGLNIDSGGLVYDFSSGNTTLGGALTVTGATTFSDTLSVTNLATFQSGFLSQASSTVGDGTQSGGLTIAGGATTTGDQLVQGNTTLSGLLDLTGAATFSSTLTVGGNLLPDTDSAYDIGADATRFANIFADNLDSTNFTLSGAGTDMILSTDSSGGVVATSTPTLSHLFATSTTATSTFAGGVNIGNGNFLVDFSSGNATIGNLLTVSGTGTSTIEDNLEVLGGLQVGNSSLYLDTDSIENLSGDLLLQPTGGNVGIGTESPGAPLHVNSGTINRGVIFESEDSDASIAFVDDSSTGDTRNRIGAIGNELYLTADNTEIIRLKDGNVGIGTSIPNALLTLTSDNPVLQFNDSNEPGDWDIFGTGGDLRIREGLFGSSPDTRFILQAGGNIGIGTNDPQNRLDISGATVIGANYAGVETAPTNGLLVEGSTGIGTTSPATEFSVSGDGYFTGGLGVGVATTTPGVLETAGDVSVGGELTVAGSGISIFTEGRLHITGVPVGTAINEGSVYVNPPSAGVNNVLAGFAVGGTEKVRIDAEGDVQITGLFNSTNAAGTNEFAGSFSVGEDTTLGDGTDDTVVFNARIDSALIPASDSSYDLGSETFRWNNIYASTTTIDNLVAGGTASSTFIINEGNNTADTENATLAFERGTETPNATLTWNATDDRFEFNDFAVQLANTLTVSGTASSSFAGPLWLTGSPQGTDLADATLYINPAAAAADEALFSVGVAGTERFAIDAEGDTTIQASLGIENQLYDITQDVLTINDSVKIVGGEIVDSTDTTRIEIGSTNTITGNTVVTGTLDVSSSAQFGSANVDLIDSVGKIAGLSTDYFNTDTSANLAGIITDETGTGALVFADAPSLTDLTVTSGGIDVTGNSTITGTLSSLTGLSSSGTIAFSGISDGVVQAIGGTLSATSSISGAFIEDVFLRNDGDDTTTGQLTAANFVASDAGATSTFAGGVNVENGGLVYDFSTNNVGIGTESPAYPLEVISGGSGTENIAFFEGPDSGLKIQSRTDGIHILGRVPTDNANADLFLHGGSSPSLTLKSDGNVGIGTVDPDELLEVSGGSILITQDSTVGALFTERTGDVTQKWRTGGISASGSFSIKDETNNTFPFQIADGAPTGSFLIQSDGDGIFDAGNVGIGTDSPSQQLELRGTDTRILVDDDGSSAHAEIGVSGAGGGFVNLANDAGSDMVTLRSYGDSIFNAGNVGIGTTNPKSNLHVALDGGSTPALSSDTGIILSNSSATGDNARLGIISGNQGHSALLLGDTDDENPGRVWYDHSSDFMALYTNDNEQVRVDNSGNVGIGTTDPTSALQIKSGGEIRTDTPGDGGLHQVVNVNANNDDVDLLRVSAADTDFATSSDHGFSLRYVGTRGGNNNSLSIFADQQTGSQIEALTVLQDGNIGIGTESPGVKLEVSGSDVVTQRIVSSGTSGTAIELQATATGGGFWRVAQTADNSSAGGGKLIFLPDSTTHSQAKVTFTNAGNVGIGTTDPGTKLHVFGSGKVAEFGDGTTGSQYITFGGNRAEFGIDSFAYIKAGAGRGINLFTDNNDSTARVRIDTGGNVGIGTTSPFAKLSVAGDGYFDGDLTVNSLTSTTSISAPFFTATDASATSTFAGGFNVADGGLVYDWQTGNVGIGTESPSEKLDINGNTTISSTGVISTPWGTITASNNPLSNSFILSAASTRSIFLCADSNCGSKYAGLSSDGEFITPGNVGIGTTSPASTLDVWGDVRIGTSSTPTLFADVSTDRVGIGTSNPGATLGVAGDALIAKNIFSADESTLTVRNGGNDGGIIDAQYWDGDSFETRFVVKEDGGVGIGTDSPDAVLDLTRTSGGHNYLHLEGSLGSTDRRFIEIRSNEDGLSDRWFNRFYSDYDDNGEGQTLRYSMATDGTTYFNGEVGLGTTSPDASLHLSRNTNSEQFIIERPALDSKWGIKLQGSATPDFKLTDMTTGTNPLTIEKGADDNSFYIDTDGNIGVGTTSPSTELEITDASTPFLRVTDSTSDIGTILGSDNSRGFAGTITNNDFSLRTNNTDRLTIDTDGNVGIGTTDPDTLLDLEKSSGDQVLLSFTNTDREWRIGQTSLENFVIRDVTDTNANVIEIAPGAGADRISAQADGDLSFNSGSLFVKDAGNVGVGTSDPDVPFHIEGGSGISSLDQGLGSLQIGSYSSTHLAIDTNEIQVSSNGSASDLFLQANGGRVGIGTNSPDDALDVTGTIRTNNGSGNYGTFSFNTLAFNAGVSGTPSFTYTGGSTDLLELSGGSNFNDFAVTSANVGIGTTEPDELLHVAGSGSSAPAIRLDNTGTGGANGFMVATADNWGAGGNLLAFGHGNTGSGNIDMVIDSSGNVGIGTTSPFTKLSVAGDGYFDGNLTVNSLTSTTSISAPFFTATDASATSTFAGGLNVESGGLVYDFSTNRVGIGTESPSYPLDVSGPIRSTSQIHAETNNSVSGEFDSIAYRFSEARGWGYNSADDAVFYNAANGRIPFIVENAETGTLFVGSNGRVGIGTDNPSAKLDVDGQIFLSALSDTAITNGVAFRRDTGSAGIIDAAGHVIANIDVNNNNTDRYFAVRTNDTNELFRVQENGNVGIGTSDPQKQLHVDGGDILLSQSGAAAQLTIDTAAGTSGRINFTEAGADRWNISMSGSTGNEHLHFNNTENAFTALTLLENGQVGVGTTSPSDVLSVEGDVSFSEGGNYRSFYWNAGAGRLGLGERAANAATTLHVFEQDAVGNLVTFEQDSTPGTQTWLNLEERTGSGNSGVAIDFTQAGTLASRIHSLRNGTTQGYNLIFSTTPDGGSLTEGARLDEDGNFGIGTDAPSEKLNVSGGNALIQNSSTGANLFIERTDGVALGLLAGSQNSTLKFDESGDFKISSDTNANVLSGTGPGDVKVTVEGDTGNVGIGTDSPVTPLHVASDGSANSIMSSQIVRITPADLGNGINIGSDGTDAMIGVTNNDTDLHLLSRTGGTYSKALTLTGTNGNVGIGTTDPNRLLEVNSGTGNIAARFTSSDAISAIEFMDSETGGGRVFIGTPGTTDEFAIFTAGTEQVRVDNNGNVGIGTTSPYAKLSVAGEVVAEKFTSTSTTATSSFAGGFSAGGGAIQYDHNTGVTSIDNIQLGALSFGADAGQISWVDMPVTSAPAAGTIQSYTAQIDGNPLLTVYSEADGSGGIQNEGVGIGTTSPAATLGVDGLAYIGGTGTSTIEDNLEVLGALQVGNSSLYLDTDSIENLSGSLALQPTGGNVGIGTTSPSSPLEVVGRIQSSDSRPELKLEKTNTNVFWSLVAGSNNRLGFHYNDSSDSGVEFTFDNNGRIGIGETSPVASLDIASPGSGNNIIRLQGSSDNLTIHESGDDFSIFNDQQNNGITIYDGTGGVRIEYSDTDIAAFDGSGVDVRTGGLLVNGTSVITSSRVGENFTELTVDNVVINGNSIRATDNGGLALFDNASNGIFVEDGGEVGIGTNTPERQLHVAKSGAASSQLLRLENLDASATAMPYWDVYHGDAGDLRIGSSYAAADIAVDTDGKVGIGNTTPDELLHISESNDGGTYAKISNPSTGSSAYAGLYLDGQGNNFFIRNYGDGTSNENLTDFRSGAGGSEFSFSPAGSEAVRIDSDGNVGIGTTDPQAKLDVSGDLRVAPDGTNQTLRVEDGVTYIAGLQLHRLDSEVTSAPNTTWMLDATGNYIKVGPRTGDVAFEVVNVSETPLVTFGGDGNVGIGSTSPANTLTVIGNAQIGEDSNTNTGNYSLIVGRQSTVTGDTSLAVGRANTINGGGNTYSITAGRGNELTGASNAAFGQNNTINGNRNFVGGASSDIVGSQSFAFGESVQITASDSYGIGQRIDINRDNSIGFGLGFTDSPSASWPKINATSTAAFFIGSQQSTVVTATSTFAILGGKTIIDPRQPATNVSADATLELQVPPTGDVFNITDSTAGDILTVDGSGNLGLGTTSPSSKLNVQGGLVVVDDSGTGTFSTSKFDSQGVAWSSGVRPSVILNGEAGDRPEISFYRGNRTYPEFSIREHTSADSGATFWAGGGTSAPSPVLTVRGNGNVGIGIGEQAPDNALHVANANAAPLKIERTSGSNTNVVIEAEDSGGTTYFGRATGGFFGIGPNLNLSQSPYFFVNNSGEVGIGTDSPSQQLELRGTDTRILVDDDGSSAHAEIGVSGAGGGFVNLANDAGSDMVTLRSYGDSIFNAGNVGIGVTNPEARLHIAGSSHTPDGLIFLKPGGDDSVGFSATRNDNNDVDLHIGRKYSIDGSFQKYVTVDNTGNVGIGTTSPDRLLHIEGSGSVVGAVLDSTSADSFVGLRFRDGTQDWEIRNESSSETTDAFALRDHTNARSPFRVESGANENSLRINSSGNVGIGTSDPSDNKLVVAGGITTSDGTNEGVIHFRHDRNDCRIYEDGSHSLNLECASSVKIDHDSNGNGGNGFQVLGNGSEQFRVDDTGNVGISNDNPSEKLHISGGNILVDRGSQTAGHTNRITIGGARNGANNSFAEVDFTNFDNGGSSSDFVGASIEAQEDGADSARLQFLTAASGSLSPAVTIDSSGNVGIGTDSPGSRLQIGDNTADSSNYITFGESEESVESNLPFIGQFSLNASNDLGLGAHSSNGAVHFFAGNGSPFADGNIRMSIKSDGKVGIGETSPQTLLHVAGGTNNGITISNVGSNDDEVLLQFAEGTNYDEFQLVGNFAGTGGSGNDITFTSDLGGGDILTLRGDGNVGVGDSSPASLFTVGSGDAFQINGSGVVTAGTWQGTAIADANVANDLTVSSGGSVDDGALSANVALYDAATSNFTGDLQQGGDDVCTEAGNCGTITYNGASLTTGFASDINTGTPTAIEWDNQKRLDGNYTHSTITNPSRIEFDSAGTYRIYVNLAFDSTDLRTNPRIRIRKNGSTYLTGEGLSGYIRAGSGHNEASNSLQIVEDFEAGDYIEVMTDQIGSSGTVTLRADQSLLVVEGSETLNTTDADTLDGFDSTYFLNASNISAGTLADGRLSGNVSLLGQNIEDGEVDNDLTISSSGSVADGALSGNVSLLGQTIDSSEIENSVSQAQSAIAVDGVNIDTLSTNGWYEWGSTQPSTGSPGQDWMALLQADHNQKIQIAFGGSGFGKLFIRRADNGTFYDWTEFWSEANDGSGSGLDADLLDGEEGSFYQNASNLDTGTLSDSRLSSNVSLLGQTIDNGELANSSLTVTAGTGLTGGGSVSLGSSVTLNNSLGTSIEKDELTDSGTLSFDWSDAEVANNITVSSAGSVDSTALTDGGTISFEWVDAEVADNLTISASGSVADGALSSNVSLLGQSISSSEIVDGTITEADLDAIDSASNGECLTYNSGGSNFEWEACDQSGTVSSGTANQLAYYASSGDTVSGASGLVYEENTTGGTWDVAGATFTHGTTTNVFGDGYIAADIDFKSDDGTEMYLLATTTSFFGAESGIRVKSLSTPWDISSAGEVASTTEYLDLSGQETDATGIFFGDSGSKVYVTGNSGGGDVHQYDLGTAWDLTSASFTQSFSDVQFYGPPEDVFFRPNGAVMYTLINNGAGSSAVVQWDLFGDPWDISDAFDDDTFDVSSQEGDARALFFKSDGTEMYIIGGTDDIHVYELSSAWDVGSASFSEQFSPTQSAAYVGLYFRPNGEQMYTTDTSVATFQNFIEEYDVDTLQTNSLFGIEGDPTHTLTVGSDDGGSFCVDDDGTSCASAGTTDGDIYYSAAHASYSDVAEKYPSREDLKPGTIVSIDREQIEGDGSGNEYPNPYVKTARRTDRAIVGAISTNPGLTLGSDYDRNEGDYSVGLSGRIPVRVNLDGGTIKPGDRITISSTTPGVGMKAIDPNAPTIGYALSGYAGSGSELQFQGEGKVMVFIDLSAGRLSEYINGESIELDGEGGSAYWQMDSSGKIVYLAPVDLNGFPIRNVEAITSASGKWAIDKHGVLAVQEVQTKKLCVGDTCVDEEGLKQLLQQANVASAGTPSDLVDPVNDTDDTSDSSTGGSSTDEDTTDSTSDDSSEEESSEQTDSSDSTSDDSDTTSQSESGDDSSSSDSDTSGDDSTDSSTDDTSTDDSTDDPTDSSTDDTETTDDSTDDSTTDSTTEDTTGDTEDTTTETQDTSTTDDTSTTNEDSTDQQATDETDSSDSNETSSDSGDDSNSSDTSSGDSDTTSSDSGDSGSTSDSGDDSSSSEGGSGDTSSTDSGSSE